VKTADTEPAFTVTEGGAWSVLFVFESVMTVPPEGAAVESVTVQGVFALAPRLLEAHCSEETVASAARFIVAP
jgi:hypothetical protein